MIRANVQTVIIIKWVLLNYIKHFLIIQSLNSDRRLEQWTPCAGCFWLHFSLAGWMHVLVCFTIMEHLNAPKMAAMQNGGFGNDYSCFKINIIVSFLFLCGCSLRSVCCAIITDGCMLGPTKRNPNWIIFWEGSHHRRRPKKMLHLLF